MPVEPFDVTDENGVRVTGTAEASRDRHGPYYDPKSEFYQNDRYPDDPLIEYLNSRDVCRINPDVLSQAVQEAFSKALARLGIRKPSSSAVGNKVRESIAQTLLHCALNPDKYVSNQPLPSTEPKATKPVGDLAATSPGPGTRPKSSASAMPHLAFPLEALFSADRARALGDWASPGPRGPIASAASSPVLQGPPTPIDDLIMNYIGREQQQNARQPRSSVFDTGAAPLPFNSMTEQTPYRPNQFANNRGQDELPIRRLTRVNAG